MGKHTPKLLVHGDSRMAFTHPLALGAWDTLHLWELSVVYIIINGNFFNLPCCPGGMYGVPHAHSVVGGIHPALPAHPEQTSIYRRSKSTAPPTPPALRMLAVLHAADNNDTSPITWSNYFQKAPNNAPS